TSERVNKGLRNGRWQAWPESGAERSTGYPSAARSARRVEEREDARHEPRRGGRLSFMALVPGRTALLHGAGARPDGTDADRHDRHGADSSPWQSCRTGSRSSAAWTRTPTLTPRRLLTSWAGCSGIDSSP